MKVAVFAGNSEVIVLAVKGRSTCTDDIDGFHEWFTDAGRDPSEYDVQLCHIGAGEGVYVKSEIKTDWLHTYKDINHWFEIDDEEDENEDEELEFNYLLGDKIIQKTPDTEIILESKLSINGGPGVFDGKKLSTVLTK